MQPQHRAQRHSTSEGLDLALLFFFPDLFLIPVQLGGAPKR